MSLVNPGLLSQVGLKPGRKVGKTQFLKGLSKLGREELDREAAGVPTLHSRVSHALFDIIDANNNNRLQVIHLGKLYQVHFYKNRETW